MKILLVYPAPDFQKNPRFGFSYEMLTVATILSQNHHVSIHDYSCEEYDSDAFLKELQTEYYDLVLVDCDSFALKRAQNIIHARIILRLSSLYSTTISYGNYCYIKKTDMEEADFTLKENNVNVLIHQINQLSVGDLPYLRRELLFHLAFYRRNSKNTLLQTAKGCENSCIFCQRKGWQDRFVAHSDSYVLGEIKNLCCQGFQNVWVIDENFTFNLPRAKRLLKKILNFEKSEKRQLNLFISSWANIDFEFIDIAASANVRIISFGIESGDSDILKYYKKNINLDSIAQIIPYANSKGIFTVGNFIIGAPSETLDTIHKTFTLIRKCQFDQVNIKTLDYMIGSELYQSLSPSLKTADHVFACSENGLTSFSLDELIHLKSEFLKSYYMERKETIKNKIMRYGFPYSV